MALVKTTVVCPHCKHPHEELDHTQFNDREKYLHYWNLPFEGEEADAAWAAKQAMTKQQAAYVMPDIQGYISQIDGSWIDSRSKHRTHLKDHGCIEVGNEKQKPLEMPKYDPKLKQTLIEVANEKLRYK